MSNPNGLTRRQIEILRAMERGERLTEHLNPRAVYLGHHGVTFKTLEELASGGWIDKHFEVRPMNRVNDWQLSPNARAYLQGVEA